MSGTFNLWIINHYAGNRELGMEYRHFFLARHLRQLGHRVSVICASYHHLYTDPPDVDGALNFGQSEEVPFVWIGTPRYSGNGIRRLWNMVAFSWRLFRFRKRIEARLGRPDAVLGSSPHPFVALNLLHLKRAYDAPILFEVRDLWPQMLIELGSIRPRHPLSYLFRWLEGIGYRRADRTISLWHSADEYMTAHGLKRDRYVYLPNGIEVSDGPAANERGADHPLVQEVRSLRASGKFVIGYGGSHGLANPLDCIVDACDLLRTRGNNDVEFYLVGDGPSKAGIVERAREAGLKNLHFHPYVSRSVILDFYRGIDVAFMGLRDLPLFRYGPTPNKLMDYLVVGKPIIFGIRSSFNPVAEAGAGLTIDPDDAAQLADAIEELQSMTSEERQAMGSAGREYALRSLDFAKLAQGLEDVVQQSLRA